MTALVGTPAAFDSAPTRHAGLLAWVREVAELTTPDQLVFCSGSREEWDRLSGELVATGALVPLNPERKPNSFWARTDPSDVARVEVLEGIGFIPRGPETQIYAIENTDLCLVATAEITLGGMHRDQTFDEEKLPRKYVGLSHCFRTEAGAPGKDAKGLYRVHQFTKVEMFAFCTPEQSDALHEELLGIEEEIFQGLKLPYHVIDTCTGDLGGPAYRKYDLEAWMPGRGQAGEYGEVTSTSNCTDYQARRLRVRYKDPGQKGTRFAHTLNGTAVAVTRALLAILENYQQADGSIEIPAALRPWVGKDLIPARK